MQKTCKRAGVPASAAAAVFFAATVFAPSEASADWILDRSAKTLTHDTSGVVLDVAMYNGDISNGTRGQIQANPSASGDIDLSEPFKEYVDGELVDSAWYVEVLDKNAFKGSSITSLTLHDKTTTIRDDICNGVTTLTRFTAGAGLTGINYNVFNGCTNLKTIDLSKATKLGSIGNDSWWKNCFSLEGTIVFPATLNSFPTGPGSSQIGKDGAGLSLDFETPTGTGVTELKDYAFEKSGLVRVDLSKLTNFSKLGLKAFFQCQKLEEVRLPGSLSSVAGNAFGKHLATDAALSVYFRSCPTFAAQSPFAEQGGGSVGSATSITLYVPRYNKAFSEQWNAWATAWINYGSTGTLGTGYPDIADPATSQTGFALPATKDATAVWVTTGSTVHVKYYDEFEIEDDDEPEALEYTGSIGEVNFTNASFSVTVSVMPASAGSATLTVQLARDDSFGDIVAEGSVSLAAQGGATLSIDQLEMGTTYYAQLVGVAGDTTGDAIPLGSFTTYELDPDGYWIFDENRNLLYRGKQQIVDVTVVNAEEKTLEVGNNQTNAAASGDIDFHPGIRGGWEVVRFAENAFQGSSSITGLDVSVFTRKIQFLGASFRECKNLVRLALPAETEMQHHAFYRCSALAEVNWEDSAPGFAAVARETFSEAKLLGGDPVFSSATSCGQWAFDAVPLTSATFGDDLVSVDTWAFKGSPALTNVVFGYGLETIGAKAFGNRTASCPVLNISFKACPSDLATDFLSGSPTDPEGRNVVVWIPYGKDGDGSTGPWLAAAEAWRAYAADAANGLSLPATPRGEGLWTPPGGGSATVFFWRDPDLIPPATMFMLR
ncbi:MAG: leucine-rich repeat protein [Kiritimatiellae bacterium]|nr:leucine-rich repeat protein [Kiritimatiellia bacterium]